MPFECSFCGAALDEVDELYPGKGAYICPRCVCELRQSWRAKHGFHASLKNLQERIRQEINYTRKRSRFNRYKDRTLNPIFVLCMQRTGSSLLIDYLSGIPNSRFSFEMLNHEMGEGIKRTTAHSKVLNHIKYSLHALDTTVCGAKFFLDQLRVHHIDLNDLSDLFPNLKVLVLYREHLAEQYISMEIANRTGSWFYSGQDPDFVDTLDIDAHTLLDFTQDCRHKYADIVEHPLFERHSLAISYEAIVDDFAGLMRGTLADFLDVEPWDFQSDLQKRIKRPLCEIIGNYDELKGILESDIVRLQIDHE